ncbi:hypothetical protein CLU79DRAFT_838801 [Phycomyces nitens]|nr:hypothetical protein CLU79DRAFT_838801 [Phycomyces nitens]
MAFVQQHRQPRRSRLSSEEPAVVQRTREPTRSSLLSESDNDWHVISTAIPSSPRSHPSPEATSPSLEPSEPESFSSFRPSDTESISDIDIPTAPTFVPVFANLPVHDGTGTFLDDSDSQLDSDSPIGFARVVRRILHSPQPATWPTHEGDFEPNSPSMPNILLPNGGIHPPSFASHPETQIDSPHSPIIGLVESDCSKSAQDNDLKFARRKHRNLDSIPTHHPSIPGSSTSAAIWATVWHHLRRLTNHLMENDTNSSETFSNLLSEAALEGCMPFGSHLHMDFATGLRSTYASPRMEGMQGS